MNDRLDATMRSLCATGARILEDFSHSDVHLQLDQAGSWCFGGWHHREYMFPGGRPGTQRYIRFTEPEDNEQCVLSAISQCLGLAGRLNMTREVVVRQSRGYDFAVYCTIHSTYDTSLHFNYSR